MEFQLKRAGGLFFNYRFNFFIRYRTSPTFCTCIHFSKSSIFHRVCLFYLYYQNSGKVIHDTFLFSYMQSLCYVLCFVSDMGNFYHFCFFLTLARNSSGFLFYSKKQLLSSLIFFYLHMCFLFC